MCVFNSCSDMNKKRPDYLEWPEYFMAIAFLSAQRSKDPATQVGLLFVNDIVDILSYVIICMLNCTLMMLKYIQW